MCTLKGIIVDKSGFTSRLKTLVGCKENGVLSSARKGISTILVVLCVLNLFYLDIFFVVMYVYLQGKLFGMFSPYLNVEAQFFRRKLSRRCSCSCSCS